MKEWLVSDKTCKGCKYYGNLTPGNRHGGRCCDYTFITGKLRKNKPAECEVKVLSEKRATANMHRNTIRMFNPKKKSARGALDG